MPVIYSYPKGTSIIDSDSVLGTDQSNKNNTVTYTMVDIKDYVLKDLLDGVQFRLPIYCQPKVLTNSLFYQDTAADTGTEIIGSTVYLNNGNNVGNLIVAQNITASDGNIVSTLGNIAAGGSMAAGQTTADPSFTFKVNGASKFTGSIIADSTITVGGVATFNADVQIDTLTSGYIPFVSPLAGGVLRDSGFYQVNAPVTSDKAIGLNTFKLDSFYGEYPDLRVASRSLNDPGVLDLFRPDGDVQAGDRVGILQYSLDDDTQYAVAQIEVKTIGNSGAGNTGGGKLCFKTSANVAGAQVTERLCIDNTEADFSVPINVTNANQSSFAGQITIPLNPVSATDAASKGYVDSQSGGGGGVGGSGAVNTIPIWSTTTDLADSQITQDNTGTDPIFDFNSITGTNQYTPPTNTVLYKLKSGDANKFSITQDGGGGVVLPSGDILNNGPSFNMGGNAFANGENALSVGSATTAFGNGSFAANFLTLASGGGASAFGLLTEATALASAAFGNKSQSTGNYSVAAGQDSIASGQSSVAIGEKGDAQGKNTFVSGFGGTAAGNNAVKFGYEGSAGGNNAAKFGFESVASGNNSIATGTGTTASGLQSIATGNNNVVSGDDSFIGGKNGTVTSASSILYGQGSSVGSVTSAAFGQSNTITANSSSSFVAGDSNNTNGQQQVKLLGTGLIASTQFGVYLGRLNDNTDTFNRFQIGNGTANTVAGRSNALSINSAGYVKLPTYGSGAVTGTATRNLSVDIDGQIIETAIGGNTNYSVQVLTASATGQKNYLYVLQGSSAVELTLPSSPSSGDSIKVSNLTTVTTCTINPGSERIMSIPQIMTLDNNKAAFELIYVGPAYGWVIVGATGEI